MMKTQTGFLIVILMVASRAKYVHKMVYKYHIKENVREATLQDITTLPRNQGKWEVITKILRLS